MVQVLPAVRSVTCFLLSNNWITEAEPNGNSENKYEIIIRPRQILQSNTVYIPTISGSLQGNNQKQLGLDQIITFTTSPLRVNRLVYRLHGRQGNGSKSD